MTFGTNKPASSQRKILVLLGDYAPFPYFFWLGIPILLVISLVFKNVDYAGLISTTLEWDGRGSTKLVIDSTTAIYYFFVIYITGHKLINPISKDINMKARIASKGGRTEFPWYVVIGLFAFWLLFSWGISLPPSHSGRFAALKDHDSLLAIVNGTLIYFFSFLYTLILFLLELKRHR